jgi:hypothetical protein
MPRRARRAEVADSKLRLIREIVGSGRHAGSCNGESGSSEVIACARLRVAENIRPIQIGLPERAPDGHAAIRRIAARKIRKVGAVPRF